MTISSAASRVQANLQELFKGKLSPGDVYIKFQLTSEITALLSMEQVQESLIVEAEKITLLPSMPESVIGIMNSRDRVFCVFDLAQLLTLPSSLIAPRHYQIIVLEVSDILSTEETLYLGFAVEQLQGITRFTADKFQVEIPQDLPSSITPYLRGCIQQTEQQLLVLDLKAIATDLSSQT